MALNEQEPPVSLQHSLDLSKRFRSGFSQRKS